MFARILAELKKYNTPVSLTMLSHALHLEPSALEGMLATLARKGRVVVLNTSTTMFQCRACPIQDVCPPEQTWYQVSEEKKKH